MKKNESRLSEVDKNDMMFKIIEDARRKKECEKWKLMNRLEILEAEINTLEEEQAKYKNPWNY